MFTRNIYKATLFVLLLIPLTVHSQYYDTGQDPASLKWLQIKTPRFNVIYPETYGKGGPAFARSLEDAYSRITHLFPGRKFRLPVIIHNHTVHSNGYVAWAPRRMEIYPTPDQEALPVDPNTQLSVHEMTHVMQMLSLKTGFTKALSLFSGEHFHGAVAGLLPYWYLEGDAVFAESALTGAGRGHSASFQKNLKAIAVEKGETYRYDKILNGSFRDFVPNYYETGFQMIAWSRLNYEQDLWNNVLNFTGSAPFTLNPVNISLWNKESLTKKRLFRETFDTLQAVWSADDELSKSESYHIINPAKGNKYINYLSPVHTENGSVIAIKTSLSHPPAFVLIDPSGRTEKKLLNPGNVYPRSISSGGGKIVWVETVKDPVWENRSWSVVKMMDISTKRRTKVTRKTRYMSATISPDGNLIAAAENSVENVNSLVLIHASDSRLMARFQSPGNVYLQRPAWSDSGEKITVIFLTAEGEGIMSFDMADRSWKTLIEADRNDLQSSFLRNDSLFFVSSVSGTENVWLMTPDKKHHPVTRSRFGATDVSIRGSAIIFSDYTSAGNNICYTTLPDVPPEKDFHDSRPSYLMSRLQPDLIHDTSVPDETTYEPVRYRKWQHLFRFHSWMPFYADIDAITSDPAAVKPGFTLMTQNSLSTLISSLGYEYSGERHKFHSNIEWHGWPLVIDSRIDYGHQPLIEKFNMSGESIEDPVDIKPGLDVTTRVYLPLLFNNGGFIQSASISLSMLNQNKYLYIREERVYDSWQTQFTGRFYLANYQRMAIRDIHPKWAQMIDLSYSLSPFDRKFYGPRGTIRTSFYFPGIFPNNGIKLNFEAEKQDTELFMWSNRTSFSRGYKSGSRLFGSVVDITSEEIVFFSADYFMPLVYPDFNIMSFLYLTRIRADLFSDFTRGTGNYIIKQSSSGELTREYHGYSEYFNSFGVELMSDFYLLRMPFMISAGVQASWRELGYMPHLKVLFNINLFGMNIGSTKF